MDIVERLRSLPELAEALPGNSARNRFYRAGEDMSELLRGTLHADDGRLVLAMDPQSCQEALAAVRGQIDPPRDATLVFDAAGVRSFARKLLEMEFPDVAVLSSAELLPALNAVFAGEIRLSD